MAGRRTDVLDIREMVRRMRLGEPDRRIARDLGVSRNTVAQYRAWAAHEGFLVAGELPEPGVLEARLRAAMPEPTPGPESSLEPYRDFILEKLRESVELRALLNLVRERGFRGSYSALRRFARKLRAKNPDVFIRVETPPGQEAQVDFGYVGEIFDPITKRLRKAWVFVMALSWSRHMFAEITFDQKVETWIELHVRAWEWFGGCVERVVLDNLRAGIVRAVVHDQEAQRSYRELAEHCGFVIAPCRPRTPRHKGKVEKGGVHYVKRNALAGRAWQTPEQNLRHANEHLHRWLLETAGVRDHGTTHEKPLARFEIEKPLLKALPATRYEPILWKQAKVHPDCHVVCDYAFYSTPHRLVGEEVWLRVTARRLEIFHHHERIATHPRAVRRGQWSTIRDHLPPEKLQGLLPVPQELRVRAQMIGASAAEIVERWLQERPLDRLRTTQALLGLARKYGAERLDAACRRALAFDQVKYHSVKEILKKGLDLQPLEESEVVGPLPKTSQFARSMSDFQN